jgi:hypothetical protein
MPGILTGADHEPNDSHLSSVDVSPRRGRQQASLMPVALVIPRPLPRTGHRAALNRGD